MALSPPALPPADADLFVTYPPGYFVKKNRSYKLKDTPLNDFTLHGLSELNHAKTSNASNNKKNNKKNNKTSYASVMAVNALKFSSQELSRIATCMKQVDGRLPVEAMKHQIMKHGRFLGFIDIYRYASFTMDMYETLGLSLLLNFVVAKAEKEAICLKEYSFFGFLWTGFDAREFMRLAQSYSQTKGALKFWFLEKHGVYFLTQVRVCVTRNREVAASQDGEEFVVIKETGRSSHDLPVGAQVVVMQ